VLAFSWLLNTRMHWESPQTLLIQIHSLNDLI
jgi:hypothetical protein